MLEATLFKRLKTLAPNLYPGAAPEKYKTPAVIYNRIDTDPARDLDGETGQSFIIAQIDVYDRDYLTSKNVAKNIRVNLTAWEGDEVQAVSWVGENDSIDNTTPVSLYRTRMTFVIFGDD